MRRAACFWTMNMSGPWRAVTSVGPGSLVRVNLRFAA
jgi:hypothetical protein